MRGIPSALNKRIREALLHCGPFDDPQQLRALFSISDQLRPWQHSIPNSATVTGQVDTLIAFLYNKPFDKPNPLTTFLAVLSDNVTGGCQQQLQKLANELAVTLGEEQPFPDPTPTPTDPGSSSVRPNPSRPVEANDLRMLHQALREAFGIEGLRELVRFTFDLSLEDISLRPSLSGVALDLVEWTKRRSRTAELICAAYNERKDNVQLKELASRYCQ